MNLCCELLFAFFEFLNWLKINKGQWIIVELRKIGHQRETDLLETISYWWVHAKDWAWYAFVCSNQTASERKLWLFASDLERPLLW